MLIPQFMESIEWVLKTKDNYEIKSSAITILSSLLCMSDHYNQYQINRIGGRGNVKFKYSDLKKLIIQCILYSFRTYNKTSTNVKDKYYIKFINKLTCCSTILIYQELSQLNPEENILKVN